MGALFESMTDHNRTDNNVINLAERREQKQREDLLVEDASIDLRDVSSIIQCEYTSSERLVEFFAWCEDEFQGDTITIVISTAFSLFANCKTLYCTDHMCAEWTNLIESLNETESELNESSKSILFLLRSCDKLLTKKYPDEDVKLFWTKLTEILYTIQL